MQLCFSLVIEEELYNTLTEFPDGRKLPGFKDGKLAVKDIINQESRFNKRKRSARSLTPTATVECSCSLKYD